MMIGYARVSSTGQNLDRQIQELERYGCEHIVVEKESGVRERPEFGCFCPKPRKGGLTARTTLSKHIQIY